ncbi:MAG: neutral zinc metallopeptidase [Planctomycetes bacterium]|nr:neutral zinc metallopeptidase [Planctomycetota bacterium]
MRWKETKKSQNVEDRRSRAGGFPGGKAGMGIGGILVAVLAMFMTGNFDLGKLLNLVGGSVAAGGGATGGSGYQSTPEDEEKMAFVSHILGSTETIWSDVFRKSGKVYKEPELVVFHQRTESGCGSAQSATGPFYCPADSKVYLDLDFFEMLSRRFGAPGDFAQAYVIAHEVGHHIQHLLGYTDMVHQKNGRVPQEVYNRWSVALELQADFLAGVWAHHMNAKEGLLERGDREEAIRCAMRIGDDTLQKEATGTVRPETFTHGSSKQRAEWFLKGLETGDFNQGDTFRALGLTR